MNENETPTPQAASGRPDGTVPNAGIPIEVFTQKLSIPTPQAGEEIRAALEQYEGDAIIRDPKTKEWIYIRTRVFVDLKTKEERDATHEVKSDVPPADGVLSTLDHAPDVEPTLPDTPPTGGADGV